MLLLAIIIVIFGAVLFVIRLWAIRRHDRVLHAMYDYRREVTGLMRADRFQSINREDYQKLRRTLDNANLVIDDFEKTRSAVFSFYRILKGFGKKAYRADVRQQRLSLAQNEEIKHQQSNLRKLLSWSVFYLTPFFFRNKIVLSPLLTLFGCARKGPVYKKSESFSEWVARNVSSPLARDFSAKH